MAFRTGSAMVRMNSGSRLAGSDGSMSSFSSSVRVMCAMPSPSGSERAVGRDASRPEPYSDSSPDVKGTCVTGRSEEHTSELQSLAYLVCRLLLEKKKKKIQVRN